MPVKLPYSRVLDVTVTRLDRFPTVTGFGVHLLLISATKAGVLDATHRTKLYSSIEEVATDWLAGTEPYLAAQRFFGRNPRPIQIKMGWRDSAALLIANELNAIYAADPDWYWLSHTRELVDTPAQRDIADWAEARNVICGLDTADVDTETAATVVDSFSTATISIASPGVVTWTAHGLLADQPVRFTTTGVLPTGIAVGTTYFVLAAGLTANTFQIGATAGGSAIATTGTQSGVHTATALQYGGSIAEYAESKNYDRTAVFYHPDPTSYLAAAAWSYTCGRNFDRADYALAKRGRIDSGQAYTLKFKSMPGVATINRNSAVTQAITGFVPAQGIDPAQGHRANTYVNIGGVDMLVEGNVASGAFVDEIHATDWIRARMQESVLGVLTTNPRIPYTNPGMGVIISAGVQPTMRRAVAAGIIAGDFTENDYTPEYAISADRVETIPVAQRRNRIAPDIKVDFRYAGAIHYGSVSMTLRF